MYWSNADLQCLLRAMLLFVHQALGENAGGSVSESLDSISEALIDEDYTKAYSLFLSSSKENRDNPRFADEYYRFLLSIGHYDEIVENRAIFPVADLELLSNYQKILRSGHVQAMAALVDVSPNCVPVLYAAAKWAIFSQDKNRLNRFIGKLEKMSRLEGCHLVSVLAPDLAQYHEILGRKHFLYRNIPAGLRELQNVGSDAVERAVANYKLVLDEFARITDTGRALESQGSVRSNLESLKQLYFHVYKLKVNDGFRPSIFLPILVNILERISEVSIQNGVSGASKFAERLLEIDSTERNAELAIRAFCLDGRVREAKGICERSKMNRKREEEMTRIIRMSEEEENRRREEAWQEQQRREQRRREQQRRRFAHSRPSQKEPDFLKYYEILDVKSNVDDKTLKKAYKKKAREADKKMRLKKAEAKENAPLDESDLIRVNKAYQVLSDSEKRRLYDMGVDPENPEPQHYQQGMDFDEVINRMFGGGRGHQQFFQFSF